MVMMLGKRDGLRGTGDKKVIGIYLVIRVLVRITSLFGLRCAFSDAHSGLDRALAAWLRPGARQARDDSEAAQA